MLSSWVPSKSQTEKCCEAELSRVASLLEIMSECLNASLVEMAAKKEHVYAHIRFKYCRVLRESRALRSHQNQFCQGLALPSIFHPLPTLSAFLFSSSVPSHLYPPTFSPIYDFTLTFNPSVTILFSSYITSPFLVSTLHQSRPRSSFLSPDSHYIHFQAPVCCLLPLGISSALSHSFGAGPLPIPRLLFCPFITFLSQTGWDGHFTW